jgi:hypothetical protein
LLKVKTSPLYPIFILQQVIPASGGTFLRERLPMKAREEIANALKRMRTFTINQLVRETYNLDKANVNWESTVRSYVWKLEKKGHVRKIGKVEENGRLVNLYQSLVMYAPDNELKW